MQPKRGGPGAFMNFPTAHPPTLLHTLQPYCTPSNLTAHPPNVPNLLHTLQNTAHPLNLAAHPLNLAAHPPNLTAHPPKLQPLFSHRKFKY